MSLEQELREEVKSLRLSLKAKEAEELTGIKEEIHDVGVKMEALSNAFIVFTNGPQGSPELGVFYRLIKLEEYAKNSFRPEFKQLKEIVLGSPDGAVIGIQKTVNELVKERQEQRRFIKWLKVSFLSGLVIVIFDIAKIFLEWYLNVKK